MVDKKKKKKKAIRCYDDTREERPEGCGGTKTPLCEQDILKKKNCYLFVAASTKPPDAMTTGACTRPHDLQGNTML